MQEAERCQINLITIKDGNMFLSSENSQKGVKNKAALKENNFTAPELKATIRNIQWEGFNTGVQMPPTLLFLKRENRKEPKQNGTLSPF